MEVKHIKREMQRAAEQLQLILILMPQRHSTCLWFHKMVQSYHFEQILEDRYTCNIEKKLFNLSIEYPSHYMQTDSW